MSLLSYGEVLIDFLPSSDNENNYIPLAGGAPANVAVGYAKLGGNSYFAGGISQDNFGNMLANQLEQLSVDTRYVHRVKEANTALVLVSLDEAGERHFNFYRQDSADMYFPQSYIDKINWQHIDIFHYCSNTLTNETMYSDTFYAIEKAKKNNLLISFDVNLRLQLWSNLAILPQRVNDCLKQSDIVKFSLDEIQYLADNKHLSVAMYIQEILAYGVSLVVVTDGANPVKVFHQDYNFAINVPVIRAVDTTAAGDSFVSGLLIALNQQAKEQSILTILNNPEHVSEAVIYASHCGAFTCQRKGAFNALPTTTDIVLP